MPLPEEFSPAEHLQDLLKRAVNHEVADWFRDLGETWEPDVSTARSSLRVGCTHVEDDSMDMTIQRLLLFYMVCKKGSDLHPSLYSLPVETYQASRLFKPQIVLQFYEDLINVDPEYSPVEGRISFRLDEPANLLTQNDLERYAQRIVLNFPEAYEWKKGKTMCSYTDKEKGYQLQILARNETEGREVIGKVLSIKSDTVDLSKLNVNENQNPTEAYPTIPDRELILGKSRRMPRKRPIADVKLRIAICHIHGLTNPIVLLDRAGRYLNPIVRQ